jgi:transposase
MKLEDEDAIDLFFTDETGFNLVPSIPYGWQPIGIQRTIRSSKNHVCNFYGLLSRKGKLKVFSTPKSINSDFMISCIDEIAKSISKPTVLILDNAPWHVSGKIKSKEKTWNDQNLYLFYLPVYSPHLNLIETLWRKIKYEWLRAEDYLSAKSLRKALFNIIEKYDDEFYIKFSKNLFKSI